MQLLELSARINEKEELQCTMYARISGKEVSTKILKGEDFPNDVETTCTYVDILASNLSLLCLYIPPRLSSETQRCRTELRTSLMINTNNLLREVL